MSQVNQQQKLTTFGYVHKHCTHNIPFVLIKLIKLFYDEYFYWNFKDEQMKKFLNAKNGDIIYSKTKWKINDIECQCTMCPNGWLSHEIGWVQFYLELVHLPSYIKNITFCVELMSETIPAFSRRIGQWSKLTSFSLHKHTLKLNQFKDIKNAYFNCKVVLKGIEFNSNYCDKKYEIIKNKYYNYIKPITIKQNSKYEWNTNTKLLKKK
eukprot:140429_1